MQADRKLLVVDCAALGWNLLASRPAVDGLTFQKTESVFPAVTCAVQASFRTASLPRDHGMIGNGLFFRDLAKVLFWEQSAALVAGPRIWSGRKTGLMFWQQSLGESVDLVVSPRPIHKHDGGMIQDCYTQPEMLYEGLSATIGRRFNLVHYWGPLASHKSSEWIVAATKTVMASRDLAPDVLFTYLPHIDYDLQRYGPESPQAVRALDALLVYLVELREAADRTGYDFLFFGDYAIEPVTKPPVFPNLALREAGLFRTRIVKGMAYPDFFASDAFAVADHAVAQVYAKDDAACRRARDTLADLPGMGEIMDRRRQAELGVDHARSGDLVLVADAGSWFAYPWWTARREAPDFASHVDIHNKPGYDPCELFFGWPPLSVSMDTSRICGTHGAVGPGREVAWASSRSVDTPVRSLLDLAAAVRAWL